MADLEDATEDSPRDDVVEPWIESRIENIQCSQCATRCLPQEQRGDDDENRRDSLDHLRDLERRKESTGRLSSRCLAARTARLGSLTT